MVPRERSTLRRIADVAVPVIVAVLAVIFGPPFLGGAWALFERRDA